MFKDIFRTPIHEVAIDMCIQDVVERDARLGSAASMLAIARTNKPITTSDIARAAEELAVLADQHGASPDIMLRALIADEPVLGTEWPVDDSGPDAYTGIAE
jgi:hypothetical protein